LYFKSMLYTPFLGAGPGVILRFLVDASTCI
jgi:hypothetical protein